MKALEFKSKIKDFHIRIPKRVQSELKDNQEKNVRVIVLMDEVESNEESVFHNSVREEFLKGYADSDEIYDNYEV
jgi:hypothetical protein